MLFKYCLCYLYNKSSMFKQPSKGRTLNLNFFHHYQVLVGGVLVSLCDGLVNFHVQIYFC